MTGFPVDTIRLLARTGRYNFPRPVWRLGPKVQRFLRSDIERWLAEHVAAVVA
jgi:predicted DNA-binding transcriptional regulator AlpA